MNDTLGKLKEELRVARGLDPADLLLRDIQILDVFTETVFRGSILIKNGKIVSINPAASVWATEEFDGRGLYAVPGFADTHIHLETTLVTPEALADAIVPWGTTTVFAEVLDFVSVTDVDSLKRLLRDRNHLPYRIFVAAPGKVVAPQVTEELLQWDAVVCLGEMKPDGILGREGKDLHKILSARAKRKVVTGHVADSDWEEMNLFATAGLMDDHEVLGFEKTFELLRLGISKMIRDGSTIDTVEEIIRGVVRNQLPTDSLMFCADDIYVNDLLQRGHINNSIQKAINAGLNPIKAIMMATINAARHFHLDHMIGSLTPGRFADIVLLEELDRIEPVYVFQDGNLVAEEGVLSQALRWDYPELQRAMPRGLEDLGPGDLAVEGDGPQVQVQVVEMRSERGHTTEERLPVHEGRVLSDTRQDILKLSMIERYPKGERDIAHFFVRGFKLKEGALATLFTQHRHSVTVLGTNDEDMCLAAKEVDRHPGAMAVAAHGSTLGVLPLPVACMMSDQPARDVAEKLNAMQRAAQGLGCDLPSPFMTLWFSPFFLNR